MDEIREYEDQLVAVQQALKEEPSDELREVEGELQSLLAELRKGLAEGEGTEDGAENGTDGADGVTARGEIKAADGVVAEADSETEAADGVVAEADSETKAEAHGVIGEADGVTGEADGEAKVIPKTDSGINTPEKPLKDGTRTPTDPPVAPTPNTPAQPDDYEVGRAKWKSFSGRIAKRKKYK